MNFGRSTAVAFVYRQESRGNDITSRVLTTGGIRCLHDGRHGQQRTGVVHDIGWRTA